MGHVRLLPIRAAGHAAHCPCRPGEGRIERGQGLVPAGGAGAAQRATVAKAGPCREREAEPHSSSEQGKVAPLAALNAVRACRAIPRQGWVPASADTDWQASLRTL